MGFRAVLQLHLRKDEIKGVKRVAVNFPHLERRTLDYLMGFLFPDTMPFSPSEMAAVSASGYIGVVL